MIGDEVKEGRKETDFVGLICHCKVLTHTEQTGRMANWVLKMRCCLLFVTTVLRLALNQCTFCFLVQGDRRKKESFTERLLLARHCAGCLRFIPLLTSTTTLRQSIFVFLLYVQKSWLKEVG